MAFCGDLLDHLRVLFRGCIYLVRAALHSFPRADFYLGFRWNHVANRHENPFRHSWFLVGVFVILFAVIPFYASWRGFLSVCLNP